MVVSTKDQLIILIKNANKICILNNELLNILFDFRKYTQMVIKFII